MTSNLMERHWRLGSLATAQDTDKQNWTMWFLLSMFWVITYGPSGALLTFVCVYCSASPVKLFHHPITYICAKIGALDPAYKRNSCLEIFGAAGASSSYSQKILFVHENSWFFFLNLVFSRLSRILVHMIIGSSLLQTQAEHWRAKLKNSHIRLVFSFM